MTTATRRLVLTVFLIALAIGYAAAQVLPDGDLRVAEVDRLQVQIFAQQAEIAQLRLAAKVQSLQRPGYDLDLQAWTYKKKPTEKKEPPK